jgi:hypothetical protein
MRGIVAVNAGIVSGRFPPVAASRDTERRRPVPGRLAGDRARRAGGRHPAARGSPDRREVLRQIEHELDQSEARLQNAGE